MHNLNNNEDHKMTAYLKVTGSSALEGDVTAKGLEKTIQLLSAGFSVTRNMNTRVGNVGDREGTKPSVSEFEITKKIDKTSPYFARDAASGTTIPSVQIIFVNTGKDLSTYCKIELKDVLVSHYAIRHTDAGKDATTEDSRPTENITLNFTQFTITHTPFGADHKAGSPVTAGYDLETAKPL
jgi:type VI secretion system Hcp family effector